jgi:hypothetical protein
LCIDVEGRRVAFNKRPSSQQLLYVEHDDTAGMLAKDSRGYRSPCCPEGTTRPGSVARVYAQG